MAEEDNVAIAANNADNNNNINGEENHHPNNNQEGGLAIQQQHQDDNAAHEIPTSDQEGSCSFEHNNNNNSDYNNGYPPHNMIMSAGPITANNNGLLLPSPSSFYSPPHFPPPPPPHLAPPMDSLDNNVNEQTQLQYYEARMREHAMQYANAAAGAAWAAARMANSWNNLMQQQQQQQSNASGSFNFDNHGVMRNGIMANNHQLHQQQQQASFHSEYHLMHQQQQQYHPTQQQYHPTQQQYPRRKLWKPPKEEEETVKKSSKKRDSGNNDDSVSSLGSESYHYHQHHHQQQHYNASQQQLLRHHSTTTTANSNKKKKKGKKNQRRRFNEDTTDADNGPIAVAATTTTAATAAAAITRNATTNNVDYTEHNNGIGNFWNNSNQRQKRGLQQQQHHHHHQPHQQQQQLHGQSSKSSFSSMGSSTNNTNHNRKKKNRSILPPTTTSNHNNNNSTNSSNTMIQGIFLGGLIGKTGVSALHELCHKYRWEKPVYTLIENVAATPVGGGGGGNDDGGEVLEETNDNDTTNNNSTSNNNNNQYQVHPHEFVLAVHVNKIELGRGRGDSKTAAKQDGSRKALGALIPGVVFDPNGILLDVGGGGGGGGRVRSDDADGRLMASSSRSSSGGGGGGGVITSMEELGPHLASQLAIGGGNITSSGVQQQQQRSRPSSPDHSETSSISTSVSMTKMSRDVGIGEGCCGGVISGGPTTVVGITRYSSNIYPCASTTSGVSSASEVEDGEDENAYYASRGASVCSTLLQAMWQIDDRIRQPPSYVFDVYPIPSAKESGGGIEQPNKRRKSGGSALDTNKKPAAHRGTFQCTATLNLYFRMDEEGKEYSPTSLMESWESPLEYLQTKDKKLSSSYYGNVVSSQESRKRKDSFASQATPSPDRRLKGDRNDEQPDNSASKRQKVDEFMKHTLESKATGSTKRESKHKASAKLLTLLFPECSSLVEVKAAAEAARECYAATKAMSSQTKRAKLSDKGSPERRGPAAERSGNLLAKSESFVSVAGLSLSEEPVDESKRIKWCDSTKAEPIAGLDVSFECEVDTALKSLRDQEEEPSDDVGRIVLCRAQPDDAEFIYALLNKASESHRCGEIANVHTTNGEDVTSAVYGSDSIFLLLSRAVASHEPLGCAILTFVSSSIGGGRSLILQNIGHEEHLPRERFIECLEAFASKLETNLDTSNIFNDVRLISPDEIRKCLSQSKMSNDTSLPPSYQGEEVMSMNIKSNSSHSLLQSVKEEDSEDADDGSDGDNINVDKEVDRAHHDPEANGKRPMRSKRRREMHDQQKHDLGS